jgi:hypothetical protein
VMGAGASVSEGGEGEAFHKHASGEPWLV